MCVCNSICRTLVLKCVVFLLVYKQKECVCVCVCEHPGVHIHSSKRGVTDCNKRRLLNDMLGRTSGVDTLVRHGPASLQHPCQS